MSTVTIRRLTFLRQGTGLSQRKFAQQVGIDASYICNAERYGMLYPKHARIIADALGWDGDPRALVDMVEIQEVS